jgi:phosphatidylserine decarboxylase
LQAAEEAAVTTSTRGLRERLFVAIQYLIPQHAVSRVVYHATRSRRPALKNRLIRWFLAHYPVDMSEAAQSDPLRFASFNEFFTRELRPGLRKIAAEPDAIVSPVDGIVSAAGQIDGDTLIQAKGQAYQLAGLLAGVSNSIERFRGGSFATIYLAPFNYHRVHVPIAATLRETWYVPGRLFSVNTVTAAAVPRLFARNERIVCLFDTPAGPLAQILVGALNVGSMSTVWHGEVTPRARRAVTRLPMPAPAALAGGEEMGRFNMGSTVILLFGPGRVSWDTSLSPERVVRLGERIGVWHPAP